MTINNSSPIANLTAEANETTATTKAEAAKGDAQAIRKLASQTTAAKTSVPAEVSEVLNTTMSGLNATA